MNRLRQLSYIIPIFILFSLTIQGAIAHVPTFGGGGDSPESAGHVHNPLKSWVIYDELHEGGEAHYYSLDMEQGQRLRLQLFTPEEDFLPGMVVMGPGIASNGTVPNYVKVPDGLNAFVFEGEPQDRAEYEPFTPASYYFTVSLDVDLTASGEYYLAVFEPERGGKYGIAVGYIEEFSLEEWVRVPFDTISIHQWEGQNNLVIIAPLVATLLIGSFLLIWPPGKGKLKPETEIWRWLGGLSGLFYLGTGFMMVLQMAIALSRSGPATSAAVTFVFIFISLVLGYALIRMALGPKGGLSLVNRTVLLVLGVLGIFLWAGLIVGSVLAIVAALLPYKLAMRYGNEKVETDSS